MTMTEEEELAYQEESGDLDITEETKMEYMTVSFNAMTRRVSLNTLRINEKAYGKDVRLLIDSGITNCFLDEETAQELGCALEYTISMQVSVADGSKIINNFFCTEFTWKIQDQEFSYPVTVIKLGGCNMVLGGD